jgi:hypothetical protein
MDYSWIVHNLVDDILFLSSTSRLEVLIIAATITLLEYHMPHHIPLDVTYPWFELLPPCRIIGQMYILR